jgi:HD superfamily phosphohydrolase YqeK
MTPQEKAKDLVEKYYLHNITWALLHAKKCALIAVDEIINQDELVIESIAYNDYWQQVKTEIEKL